MYRNKKDAKDTQVKSYQAMTIRTPTYDSETKELYNEKKTAQSHI